MLFRSENKLPTGGQIVMIPHEEIRPNPNQPRRHFDYDELEGLAESIRSNGILQPLCVRIGEGGGYELISGERRLRAARITGMVRIPCIIMDADEQKSALYALLENLQRQDLDFFEEARAIERLMVDYGISQEEMAKKLGKAQSTLSNKLRILKLPEEACLAIEKAGLTERHARALLKLENREQVNRALAIVIDKRLNVAETERLIAQMLRKDAKNKKPPMKIFKDVRLFVNTLNHAVDTMRRAGIDADSARSETEEYIEYVVRIPKAREIAVKSNRAASA